MSITATTTVTTAEDPLASSGHAYPEDAKGEVRAYWWQLDALRGSRTRAEAAGHAGNLAIAAGRIANALPGAGEAAGGTWADPRAWASLSVYLARLTLALHGDPVKMQGGWPDLAAARTRAEFAAAWCPVGERLRQRALDGSQAGGDDAELSAFAAGQVVMAATVIIGAPW